MLEEVKNLVKQVIVIRWEDIQYCGSSEQDKNKSCLLLLQLSPPDKEKRKAKLDFVTEALKADFHALGHADGSYGDRTQYFTPIQ